MPEAVIQKLQPVARGAFKSWTVWFSALLMFAPSILEQVQANWATLAPFVPDAREKLIMQIIALVVFLLRLKTTTSLAARSAPP